MAVPALIIFGGMSIFRVLSGDADDFAFVNGTLAALAILALAIGIMKAKQRDVE